MEGVRETAFIPFVFVLSLIHALIPDHWLPFVMVGRIRKWSPLSSSFYALFSMSIHIVVSLILGGLAFFFGLKAVQTVGEVVEKIAGGLLILFGIMYMIPRWWYHGKEHPVSLSERGEGLYLSLVAGISPCIFLLPILFAVAPSGLKAMVKVILVFAIPTLTLPPLLVYFTTKGLLDVKWKILETHGETISGFIIALLGIVVILF